MARTSTKVSGDDKLTLKVTGRNSAGKTVKVYGPFKYSGGEDALDVSDSGEASPKVGSEKKTVVVTVSGFADKESKVPVEGSIEVVVDSKESSRAIELVVEPVVTKGTVKDEDKDGIEDDYDPDYDEPVLDPEPEPEPEPAPAEPVDVAFDRRTPRRPLA